jgi:hypothetical protein
MRTLLYAAAAGAVALALPRETRTTLAAAASVLLEATPFLLAATLLARAFGRCAAFVEFAGCGCGRGPSARSLPATVATWLLFGPFIAVARHLAACGVAAILHRNRHETPHDREVPDALAELAGLLPAAVIAAVAMQFGTLFVLHRLSVMSSALLGAALGFTAAPCGLGAVAVAAALAVRAPFAAGAFLCVAGIFDLRTLRVAARAPQSDDAFGYALLAAATAIVALRGGGALVHPAFTAALAACAAVSITAALLVRGSCYPRARIAPAIMLLAALTTVPAPQYRETETTLRDLFAGERITFTGALTRDGKTAAIVRYAIACCRADAAPIVLRLDRTPNFAAGTWLKVEGRVESSESGFRLVTRSIEKIAEPADPFVYR